MCTKVGEGGALYFNFEMIYRSHNEETTIININTCVMGVYGVIAN